MSGFQKKKKKSSQRKDDVEMSGGNELLSLVQSERIYICSPTNWLLNIIAENCEFTFSLLLSNI